MAKSRRVERDRDAYFKFMLICCNRATSNVWHLSRFPAADRENFPKRKGGLLKPTPHNISRRSQTTDIRPDGSSGYEAPPTSQAS
jgi:hypothetical protein